MLLTWLLRKLHGLAPVEPEVTPCCRGAKIPRWRMELPETRPYILASSNEQRCRLQLSLIYIFLYSLLGYDYIYLLVFWCLGI